MEPAGISPSKDCAGVDAGHDGGLIGRHHVDTPVAVGTPLNAAPMPADNYDPVDLKGYFCTCFHDRSLTFSDFSNLRIQSEFGQTR
jgi:hypothetical protein